jgi:hypothetical protein
MKQPNELNLELWKGKTLQEATNHLEENLADGVFCPCCKRFNKEYERKFNSAMAICLLEFYKTSILNSSLRDFTHIADLFLNNKLFAENMNGGNFATIAYWELIEEMPKDHKNTTSRTSGYWRITQKGIDFVNSKIQIPKYIYTHNATLLRVSDTVTDIQQSLGNKFNYVEMMQGEL